MTIQTLTLSLPCFKPLLRRRTSAWLATLAASSLLLACGGGGSSTPTGGGAGADAGVGDGGEPNSVASRPGDASAAGETGEAGAPSASCDDRPTESVTLDQPFWQTGFKVTLGTAVLKPATPSCSPGILTVDAEFENRGIDTTAFDARILLSSAGKDYEPPSYDQDLPEVPGDRMGKGSFTFAVDDTFSLDDATLSFGAAMRHQAKVPLGKDSPDQLITLEPQTLPLKNKVVAGNLTFQFDSAFAAADAWWRYESLPADAIYVRFDLSLTLAKNLTFSDAISDDAFVLQLPDGTSIAPYSARLLFMDKADVAEDYSVSFMLPAPASGKYTLEVREITSGSDTPRAKAQLPVELPSFPTFGDE